MTIALWVVQDLQASADPKNRKRKGKIEQAKNHLVSHVITSGFSRIARNRSAVMADDDSGGGKGTETLAERFQAEVDLLAEVIQVVQVTSEFNKLLASQQMCTSGVILNRKW